MSRLLLLLLMAAPGCSGTSDPTVPPALPGSPPPLPADGSALPALPGSPPATPPGFGSTDSITGAVGPMVDPPETLEEARERCSAFKDKSDVYGSCLVEQVPYFKSIEMARTLCAEAGAFGDQCRSTWAFSRGARKDTAVSMSDLLAFCGTDEDCAFEVIDRSFTGNVVEAIGLCRSSLHRLADDCQRHAITRWIGNDTPPQQAEIDAARRAATPEMEPVISLYLGRLDACGGTTYCDQATGKIAEECGRERDRYRSGELKCPTGDPAPNP